MRGLVRVCAIALAFTVAGCVARTTVSAPSPEPSPSATPNASVEPTASAPRLNASNDVLYVRRQGGGGEKGVIAVVDARTGAVRANLPDGAISPDLRLVYSSELTDGATRTVVHVREIDTAKELRTFAIDGDLNVSLGDDGTPTITRDGKQLILRRFPAQINGQWVNSFVFLDTSSGAILGRIDLAATSNYSFVALSGDHVALLNEFGNFPTVLRAYDIAAKAFLPGPAVSGWDGVQDGNRTPFLTSTDGRWLFAVNTSGMEIGTDVVPFVLALDTATRKATRIPLPADQRSGDFEKYMLWTLVASPDGTTIFASNAALGVVDEIDAKQLTLRRTQRLSEAPPTDLLAQVRQALFPVADAKRYLRGGAAISPDGRSLYTVDDKGVAVIDTATLTRRATWLPDKPFDGLKVTADGSRIYALNDDGRTISIIDARNTSCASATSAQVTGCTASLGEIVLPGFVSGIVRIDAH